MKSFSFLLILFWFSQAHSAIIMNSVSVGNASNVVQNTHNSFDAYGSFLGAGHGDTSDVFDSCNELIHNPASFIGCNARKIHPDTVIRVQFNDDVQFQGMRQVMAYVRPVAAGGSVGTVGEIITLENTQNQFTQNANFFASFKWREVCRVLASANGTGFTVGPYNGIPAACLDGGGLLNGSITIVVGVANANNTDIENPINVRFNLYTPDPSVGLYQPTSIGSASITGADGWSTNSACPGEIVDVNGVSTPTGTSDDGYDFICDFAVTPGDRKLRIEGRGSIINSLRFIAPTSSVDNLNIPVQGVRFYTSNVSFAEAIPGGDSSAATVEFRIPGDLSTLEASIIETDETRNTYPVFVRAASIDIAGNVTHLTSDDVINSKPECGPYGAAAEFSTADPTNDTILDAFYVGPDSCPYATAPGAVHGILDGDFNCFIATALRGSHQDYQVQSLREFRNRFLNTHSLGKKIIDIYYTHGPQAAKWLHNHPQYKSFFLILLWPIYLLALAFNFLGLTGLVLLGVGALSVFLIRTRLNTLFKP